MQDAAVRSGTAITQNNLAVNFTYFETTNLNCTVPNRLPVPAKLSGFTILVTFPIKTGQGQLDYRYYGDRLFLCSAHGPGPLIKIDRPTDQRYFETTPPVADFPERGTPPATIDLDPLIRHERARFGNSTLRTLAYSPDGNMLAVGGSMGVYLLSTNLEPIAHLNGGTLSVTKLIWSPTGDQIATLVADGSIELWDVKSGSVKQIGRRSVKYNSLDYAPDGTRLVASTDQGIAEIWDIAKVKMILGIAAYSAVTNGSIGSVAWNPNGENIAVGGSEGVDQFDPMVIVFDATTGMPIKVFSAVDEGVSDKIHKPIANVQWLPDSKHLAIIPPSPYYDEDHSFYPINWDTELGGVVPFDLNYYCTPLLGFSLSPDANYYIVPHLRCEEGDVTYGLAAVFLSDDSTNPIVPIDDLSIGHLGVQEIAWRGDSRQFAILLGTSGLDVFDLTKPDSDNVAVVGRANSTLFGSLADDLTQDNLGEPDWEVISPYQYEIPTASPDGKLLAAYDSAKSSDGAHIILFDTSTGKLFKTLDTASIAQSSDRGCGQNCVNAIHWSRDGKRLEGEFDTATVVWEVGTGHVLFTKSGPSSCFWANTALVLACQDRKVEYNRQTTNSPLYSVDATTGKTLQTTSENPGYFKAIWSPNRRIACIITQDNHILIWDGGFQHLLLEIPGSDLTWSNDGLRFCNCSGVRGIVDRTRRGRIIQRYVETSDADIGRNSCAV